jgi:hypothetical protein
MTNGVRFVPNDAAFAINHASFYEIREPFAQNNAAFAVNLARFMANIVPVATNLMLFMANLASEMTAFTPSTANLMPLASGFGRPVRSSVRSEIFVVTRANPIPQPRRGGIFRVRPGFSSETVKMPGLGVKTSVLLAF